MKTYLTNEQLISAIDSFRNVCKEITEDGGKFANFKSNHIYRGALEHVSKEQGEAYLKEIKRINPAILNYMDKFATNDRIGKPYTYYFDELKMEISPTTLRYIKVLCDLVELFWCLDDLNIVEIGVGYGGQCKIINDVFKPKSYTLIDLPEVLALSDKYLNLFDVKDVILRNTNDPSKIKYDLCISNYAFTEIDRDGQLFYKDKIIENSAFGYITCNFFGYRKQEDALTKEEVLMLKLQGRFIPEVPLTDESNIIYIWK